MPVSRNMKIHAVFYYCFAIIQLIVDDTSGFLNTTELYEGSQCTTENGTAGICKKLPECPPRIADVQAGRRTTDGKGRCSFENFVEIVCCPLTVSDKIGVRAADAACHEYENEITSKNEEGLVRRRTDNEQLVFHIFAGTRAAVDEFPYMAALGYENTDGEIQDPIVYQCGGTLISSLYVLTAAHCVSNINNRVPVKVRIGSENLKSAVTNAQEIAVSRIIPHPKYKRSVNYNDIALVRMAEPVRRSNNIKPICLQTRSLPNPDITEDTSLVVIGFGATSFDVASSVNLMKSASLSFVPRNVCATSYVGFSKLPLGLDESMICAVDSNSTSGSDACQGDSGGPLLIISGTAHSVVGVTSFGQSCGGPVPAVYTSVYSYLDWIESHVWPEQFKL